MRRHSLIARLGPADATRVSVREAGSVQTEIRFVDGQRRLGYGLGQMIDRLRRRSVFPTDTAIDLGILAATVTAADTRICRAIDSQDSWTREIDLYLPVADPALWERSSALLARMLNFLTGDRWRLSFRGRHQRHQTLVERPRELSLSNFDSVCLFSGGLDSFTGAIDLLHSRERSPIFISHYWDNSTSSQKVCAQRLGSTYGDLDPRHVRVRLGFKKKLVNGSVPEPSQRGRSFLFFTLAVLAASGLGRPASVFVPENGLISLNVPLDPLRVGACSTRTTHPFYMARWNELMRALGMPIEFVNPYRFQTKGEMLARCANTALLKRYVAETISCSSFTKGRYLKLSPGHCGYCVPCLIRRASIEYAFGADPTPYPAMPSLTARPINASKAEGEHIRSFQMMARRLAQRPGLANLLVHKSGPLSDYARSDVADYASVFKRGIEEVHTLVRNCVVRPL